MTNLYLAKSVFGCYAAWVDNLIGPNTTGATNDLGAYVPQIWAQEGLAILEENMVMANLVHRDFENSVAKFGDVVNTRKPVEFTASRKDDGMALVQENATATNVRVPLDQWFYKSFVIKDGEGSMAFQDLKDIYLQPAMQSIARGIDRAILGRVHAFLSTAAKRAGDLGLLDDTTAKDYILDAREILNVNRAPQSGRRLVLSSTAETAALKTELFIAAHKRGDGGSALENAILGRILGFDTYLDQNTNSVVDGCDTVTYQTSATNYVAGVTVLGTAATGVVGEYAVVAGNYQPTWLVGATGGANVTLSEGLKHALTGAKTVTEYSKCAVDSYTKYVAGWSRGIACTGYTAAPQVGQLVSFGSTTGTRQTYTVIESVAGTILLDRPLEKTLGDANVYPGPVGSFNLAFHRDAIALVTRPLALPNAGVQAGIANYNGIGMRVCMQYDISQGGTIVNCDLLAGVAVLDTDLAVVLLG